MIKRDIIIVDHISLISQTNQISKIKHEDMMSKFSIKMKNIRKYRGRIEKRKQKIKRLYE